MVVKFTSDMIGHTIRENLPRISHPTLTVRINLPLILAKNKKAPQWNMHQCFVHVFHVPNVNVASTCADWHVENPAVNVIFITFTVLVWHLHVVCHRCH